MSIHKQIESRLIRSQTILKELATNLSNEELAKDLPGLPSNTIG